MGSHNPPVGMSGSDRPLHHPFLFHSLSPNYIYYNYIYYNHIFRLSSAYLPNSDTYSFTLYIFLYTIFLYYSFSINNKLKLPYTYCLCHLYSTVLSCRFIQNIVTISIPTRLSTLPLLAAKFHTKAHYSLLTVNCFTPRPSVYILNSFILIFYTVLCVSTLIYLCTKLHCKVQIVSTVWELEFDLTATNKKMWASVRRTQNKHSQNLKITKQHIPVHATKQYQTSTVNVVWNYKNCILLSKIMVTQKLCRLIGYILHSFINILATQLTGTLFDLQTLIDQHIDLHRNTHMTGTVRKLNSDLFLVNQENKNRFMGSQTKDKNAKCLRTLYKFYFNITNDDGG